MKCKDCGNFEPSVNIEAGRELSPNINTMDGRCNVSNKNCKAVDSCGCGSFTDKK